MKDSYTHIILVCDRSGSMAAVRQEAEAAVNHFIEEQRKVEGEATIYFVEFDAGVSDWYHVVHQGDLKTPFVYQLVPRGMTALFDATGKAIAETGEYLARMDEAKRPARVIFVVQTDGQENSSKEYTLDRIREMVKIQENDYNWQFVFLGMGPDTFEQGVAMGMSNVVQAANTGPGHANTYAVMDAYTVDYRTGNVKDMSAMRGVTVNAQGKVYDKDGFEVDPTTGKRISVS